MKVDSLYEATPKQLFVPTLTPKQLKYSPKRLNMILNWVNIESVRQGNAFNMKRFDMNIDT